MSMDRDLLADLPGYEEAKPVVELAKDYRDQLEAAIQAHEEYHDGTDEPGVNGGGTH